MSSLLVRDVNPEAVTRLKARAVLHGRSLQAEVKAILEAEAALSDHQTWVTWMDAFRSRAGARGGPDAVELLRESRDER